MNSKERLMTALRHKVPDRVPISTYELVGWNPSSWENNQESYKPLMEYIREKTDCIYMTNVPQNNQYVKNHTNIKKQYEGRTTYTRVTIATPKGDITSLSRADEGLNTVWKIEPFITLQREFQKTIIAVLYLSHLTTSKNLPNYR